VFYKGKSSEKKRKHLFRRGGGGGKKERKERLQDTSQQKPISKKGKKIVLRECPLEARFGKGSKGKESTLASNHTVPQPEKISIMPSVPYDPGSRK